MKNFFSKIFKNNKRQPTNHPSAAVTQGPKVEDPGMPRAKGQGLGLIDENTAGNNRTTASHISKTGVQILDDICAFLARYLHCSPEQRTVLALWILHTHSFPAARSTPYLAIQSARKLSGKSLCLRLLSLLSAH